MKKRIGYVADHIEGKGNFYTLLFGVISGTFALLVGLNNFSLEKKLAKLEYMERNPIFSVSYLDADNLALDQLKTMREAEQGIKVTVDKEIYARTYRMPIIEMGLHKQLRSDLIDNLEGINKELEQHDQSRITEHNLLDESVLRTNSLLLVLHQVGGGPAFDVKIKMEKRYVKDRNYYNKSAWGYLLMISANSRGTYGMSGEDPRPQALEEIEVRIGDLLAQDGRIIELEAYGNFHVETSGKIISSVGSEYTIATATQYVPISVSYKNVIGEEVTQKIRLPNEIPTPHSRGIIVRG